MLPDPFVLFRSGFTDKDGVLTRVALNWLRELWLRVGQFNANPLTDTEIDAAFPPYSFMTESDEDAFSGLPAAIPADEGYDYYPQFDGTRLNPDHINISAGHANQAQIHFASGALKTNPVAGDMEFVDGHWYLTNGARHAITTSSGIKTSTTTVVNTVTETALYSYTFAANELHTDERIVFRLSGVVSNASVADDYIIRFKVGGVTTHTINRVGGNVTDEGFEVAYEGTLRTSGAGGTFVDHASFNEGTLSYQQGGTATHAVDTTTTVLFEATVQWSAAKAGNTISCTQGSLTFNH